MFKVFKKIYSFLLKYKGTFIAFVFVLIVSSIAENINPYVYKLLIDAIPSKDYQLLIKIVVLITGVKIGASFFFFFSY